jgi:6-phosphogluconolactonase/glucosamine-6-phosphate isomerase/deaminase
MDTFRYGITEWAPLRDRGVCDRVRAIERKDLVKHANGDFRIEVVPDDEFAFRRVWDIFSRIKGAADENRRLVLILPQPHPQYAKVAYLINRFRVDCRNLFTFNMDEWADEEGNIAPETWPRGFMYAMKKNFYSRLDPELRPPEDQIQGPTNKNLEHYGRIIDDSGGADVVYGGIGWSGHLAFIDPHAPEFEGDFEAWKRMGPRIVTLHPFTIAQCCLDPDFGMSGDWSWIPPKGATIGPAQILGARLRSSWNPFTIAGTPVSWQRFTVRLAAHGPVTHAVPASILQTCRTDMYISETIAANIEEHGELSWY